MCDGAFVYVIASYEVLLPCCEVLMFVQYELFRVAYFYQE